MIPSHEPAYMVYAGMVFTLLSYPYLQEWGDEWIRDAPENLMRAERQAVSISPWIPPFAQLNLMLLTDEDVSFSHIGFR